MSTTPVELHVVDTAEAARIITVSQIVEGEVKCHCGADAVLVVDTEPDNEPGPTCYPHAYEWIDIAVRLVERTFGPNDERTK